MDHKRLRKNIKKFRLKNCARGSQGYNRVLLQLFGMTGHGKSSLVNSCLYVLQEEGKFIEHADAKFTHGGNTMIRGAYYLTKNITIVDNRGYDTMHDFQKAEIYAQLGNFLPLNQKVEWAQNYRSVTERVVDSDIDPNYTDFIVPVLVYSSRTALAEQEKEEVKGFMDNCVKMTGVAPIIVLTNKTRGNYIEMEKVFKLLGAEIVISIENYTKESQLKTLGRSNDILMFLDGAIKQVKYRMEEKRIPRHERAERMKFLLQYVKEIDDMENERKRAQSVIRAGHLQHRDGVTQMTFMFLHKKL